MAEKGFGVKEVNLIGASGTPTITSPNNLNLNAVNVAISTNASIGGNLTVSGTVGIAGTLTYEDVTNIDSVGIVTAREGVFLPDNKQIKLGNTAASPDFKIYHNTVANTTSPPNHLYPNSNYIDSVAAANLFIRTSTAGIYLGRTDGAHAASFHTNGSVVLYHNASGGGGEKFRTNSTGINVTGNTVADGLVIDGNSDLNGDLDVDGHTNLDNVSVAGVSTFSGNVTIDAGTNTTLDVVADSAGVAMVRATGASNDQTTAAFELRQSSTSLQGGGISYNGDGSPSFVSGETADNTTFYRLYSGTRYEVFSYPYNSNTVTFNGDLYGQRFHGPVTGNLTGTVINAAQPNITSLGTLTGLSVSGTTSPVNFTHTGGNCVTFNRNSKQLAINANYAGNDAYANIIMTSGMDIRWTLGGADRIVFKSDGHIEPHTDSQINLGANAKRFANVYADTLYGDGSNLTGIAADKIFEGNTEVETVDTGSDGHVKITTEGSERARITSAGKFLIGTSTPQGNANADDLVVSTSGHSGITIRSGTSSNGNIFFADGTSGGDEYRGVIDYNHSSNHMSFSTNAVERVRIDSSGNLMINSTSAEAKLDVTGGVSISSNGVTVSPSGYDLKIRSNTAKLGIHIDNSSGTPILEFGIGGATGGRITTNTNAGPIIIAPNNVERLRIAPDGQILPGADDAQNLGSSTKRWKNIYAADMHFSNEGKTNDVDGTWGDWTLQEGEDSVFMINNRTGKKYAITMREVN